MDTLATPDDLLKFMSRVSRDVIKLINAAKRSGKNFGRRVKTCIRHRKYTKYPIGNDNRIFRSKVCTFTKQREKSTLKSRHGVQHGQCTLYEQYLQQDNLQMNWQMGTIGRANIQRVDFVPYASSPPNKQCSHEQNDQYGSNSFHWYDTRPFHCSQIPQYPLKHEYQYMRAGSTSSHVEVPPLGTTERLSFDEEFLGVIDLFTNNMSSGSKQSYVQWNPNAGSAFKDNYKY